MNRASKEAIVNQLKVELAETPLIGLIDYRGVTVEQINQVRRKCEEKGIRYVVRKNTLVKKAIEGTDREGLGTLLTGMTGMTVNLGWTNNDTENGVQINEGSAGHVGIKFAF